MPGTLRVLLIRHAEPVPPGDPRFEENDRPLSDRGRVQAMELASGLGGMDIAAVYSSPYPRAVQTVQPLADARRLTVTTVPDLRERLLSPQPLPDWREHLEAAWRDHDYCLPGAESGRAAQARAMAALEEIAARHPQGGTVALGSHGNLIALVLHAAEPGVDYAFWSQIPMPALYVLERSDAGWRVLSGPGL
ncbi:MAG TPA: histidine phosphatase family protein [Deinococcales bacterium]|nr:histidine phosphatase family protein [Deinococcales bacterium]